MNVSIKEDYNTVNNSPRFVYVALLFLGAQCATSNTYQATMPGFVEAGFSPSAAAGLIWKAVEMANEARDIAGANQKQLLGDELTELNDSITTIASTSDWRPGKKHADSNGTGFLNNKMLPDVHVLSGINLLKVIRSCGPYGGTLKIPKNQVIGIQVCTFCVLLLVCSIVLLYQTR